MLIRIFLFIILITLLVERLSAQDGLAVTNSSTFKGSESAGSGITIFEFQTYVTDNDLISISQDLIQDHLFGPLVARKLYLLESKYTFQVPVVPGNPQTKTVIRKAVIYEAVQKIEHFLKKSVRKGILSNEEATKEYNSVLDVALNAFAANSNNFEKIISKTDDPASLLVLFTKRVRLIS
ncbi:MAG: hypothetical protein WCJ95_09005 [Mariniphaga sp.]|jgi:hypothetical protein